MNLLRLLPAVLLSLPLIAIGAVFVFHAQRQARAS